MKTLLRSLLLGGILCCSTLSYAQSPAFPYNPDVDSNSYIELTDLLSFLTLYGQPWSVSNQATIGDMLYYGNYQDEGGVGQMDWFSLPIGIEGQLLTVTNGLPQWKDAATILIETFPCLATLCAIPGCTDTVACNYNPDADLEDASCIYFQDGACDCDGNVLDVLGLCGGDCEADVDADGVCDDEDACVGDLDACGVCNGLGAVYDCGCADLQEGACDCDGNVLDECGVCGGSGIPDGACDCDGNVLDVLGLCGGDCEADEDADGVCDDEDACVGDLDACGVCNGLGAVYDCGCADLQEGACDCDGNVLDECGVCGGSGIPDGDCDCAGNVLDECGFCNADSDCDSCIEVDGYNVGDIGPAGGIVIYDLGYYEYVDFENSSYDCWRYIEVSTEVLSPAVWGCTGAEIYGLTNEIGSGEINTQLILNAGCVNLSLEFPDYAALSASSYNGGGQLDWFLPSPSELMLLSEIPDYTDQINGWELGKYWASNQVLSFLGSTVEFSVNLNGELIATPDFINAEDYLLPILPMRRF